MSKYFITYNNGRSFYSYINSNKYVELTETESMLLLTKILNSSIHNIIEIGEKAMEIHLKNSDSIIIDDLRIFQHENNIIDGEFDRFRNLIMHFNERKNIDKYKESIPKDYKPRVNRHRNSSMPKKLIATGLTLVLTMELGYNLMSSIEKKEKFSQDVDVVAMREIDDVSDREITKINSDYDYVVPEQIALDFEDRTDSGKLEETQSIAGSIIEYYASRYGLDYNICCAQITQERGNIYENPCQITYSLFEGIEMHVPVYDENGFTNTYDDFVVTREMLNTLEGNIMVGLAYDRACIDKFDSVLTGLFSYNQGEFALGRACEHFGVNIEDYKGDKNALKARDLVNQYYASLGKKHGDSNYLEHVLSYLPTDRGLQEVSYYVKDKEVSIDILNNTLYNNEITR